MKNKILVIVAIFAIFILAATVSVGLLPFSMETEESIDTSDTSTQVPSGNESEQAPSIDSGTNEPATDSGTTDSSGGNASTPVYEPRFESSDALTTTVMAAAENGAWVTNDGGGSWEYSAGSLYRVAVPGGFVFPDDDIIVRVDPSLSTRVYDLAWFQGNGSIPLDHFKGHITFKKTDGSEISVDDVKNGVHFYKRSEISNNLSNMYLTDEYLDYLIDLLVCQGIYGESSINGMMKWHNENASNIAEAYYGNRICMRYPVRVFSDVKVTLVSEAYEYILYTFNDTDSMVATSTIGWSLADAEFVIPAGTAFCIGIRPAGLTDDQTGEFDEDRDQYGYVYVDDWTDIVSFEIVE